MTFEQQIAITVALESRHGLKALPPGAVRTFSNYSEYNAAIASGEI